MSVTLYGQGQTILQVLQTVNTTQYSTTTLGAPIATGITASITPLSATSQILIMVNLANLITTTTSTGVGVFLYGNGGLIFSPSLRNGAGSYGIYSADQDGQCMAFTCSVAAGSTASQTYTIYMGAGSGGTAYINYVTTYPSLAASQSTITLLEISGS
jgi:hypothetical protein